MKLGNYENPKYQKEPISHKIACVVPIFVRVDRVEGYMLRGKVSFDLYKEYIEDKLETIKFMFACHNHYKPGVEYELILIDNGTPNEEAKAYLKDLRKNGIIVLNRDNIGFSFGAYKYAWETFGDKYDYYLFHEQDVVPSKDNWLSDIVSAFLSKKEIGAVGNVLEARGHGHPLSDIIMDSIATVKDREFMFNLDGAFTFTSTPILKKVDKVGGLVISPCDGTDDIGSVINETGFQQPILELGYSLATFDDGSAYYSHGIGHAEFEGDNIKPKKLSPLIHCHVRDNIKWFKEYFNWYENIKTS